MTGNENVNKTEDEYFIGLVKAGLKSQGSEDPDKDFDEWFDEIKKDKGMILNRSVIMEMVRLSKYQTIERGIKVKGYSLGFEAKQKVSGYVGRIATLAKTGRKIEGEDEVKYSVFSYEVDANKYKTDAEFAPIPLQPIEVTVDKVKHIESEREFYQAADGQWINFPEGMDPIETRNYSMPLEAIEEDVPHFSILNVLMVQGVNWYDGQKHDEPLPVIDAENNVNLRLWSRESNRLGEDNAPSLTINIRTVEELLDLLAHELKKSGVSGGEFIDYLLRSPPALAVDQLGALKGMEIAVVGTGSRFKYQKDKPKSEWEEKRFPDIKFMALKVNYMECLSAALERVAQLAKKNITGLDEDFKPIKGKKKETTKKDEAKAKKTEPKTPEPEESGDLFEDDTEDSSEEAEEEEPEEKEETPAKDESPSEPAKTPEKGKENMQVALDEAIEEADEGESDGEFTTTEKMILAKIEDKGEFSKDDMQSIMQQVPSDEQEAVKKDLQKAGAALVKRKIVKNSGKKLVKA